MEVSISATRGPVPASPAVASLMVNRPGRGVPDRGEVPVAPDAPEDCGAPEGRDGAPELRGGTEVRSRKRASRALSFFLAIAASYPRTSSSRQRYPRGACGMVPAPRRG